MEKSPKSESYIIKEAQNVIEEYIKRKKEYTDKSKEIWKEKYERLKILSICMLIAQSILIILNLILK